MVLVYQSDTLLIPPLAYGTSLLTYFGKLSMGNQPGDTTVIQQDFLDAEEVLGVSFRSLADESSKGETGINNV